MKIFMSHSSRQKLFVKELRKHLPGSVGLWIDERELRVGAAIESELEIAVMESCDFFILIVDHRSNSSDWVQKEISWAIKRESETGQTFLLPIVVEPEAWEDADPRIRDRKFLVLQDFTDENIAAIGRSLTSEIFDWLSNRLEAEKTLSPGELERRSNAELLKSADQLTRDLADRIKLSLLPFRANNPISLQGFMGLLRSQDIQIANEDEMYDILVRLNSNHQLNGVEFDEDYVFLSRENYDYKSSLHAELKKRMARAASATLEAGQTIALDGGSSVLAIAKIIARRLRMSSLTDMNIITNSIPAAALLIEELSQMGAGDRDRSARVFLLGGYARPTSLTTVPFGYAQSKSLNVSTSDEYERIIEITGPVDIAFLGANGIYKDEGLGTKNPYETSAKKWMIKRAAQRIILMDPTKLEIQQEVPFADLNDALKIFTGHLDEHEEAISRFAALLSSTNSTLEVVR